MPNHPYGSAHKKPPTPPPTRPWANTEFDDRDRKLIDLVIDHPRSTIKQLWQMTARRHQLGMSENDTRKRLRSLRARGYVACSNEPMGRQWSVVAELRTGGAA